jgi:hypothetical protein
METDPDNPRNTPSEGLPVRVSADGGAGTLVDPVPAYTANGNLEAHSAVTWLESNGVRSHAVEDNSGVSLFMFGTISQFHKPQVFVDRQDLERAGDLLRQFEVQRDKRRQELDDAPPIKSECEECGELSEFPGSQNGTTQNCPKCHAFMDVGSFDWPDDFDFGVTDTKPDSPDNADDAMDAASKLEKGGDWDDAITAYEAIADRWPEHARYVANCIADVQRKLDASR